MTEVEQLEKQREDFQQLIERANMVERLALNPDFKKLILEGFCRDDAATYVQISQDPNIGDREQADALRLAQASGHLKRFLQVTRQMGTRAAHTMEELDQAIVIARQEGGE